MAVFKLSSKFLLDLEIIQSARRKKSNWWFVVKRLYHPLENVVLIAMSNLHWKIHKLSSSACVWLQRTTIKVSSYEIGTILGSTTSEFTKESYGPSRGYATRKSGSYSQEGEGRLKHVPLLVKIKPVKPRIFLPAPDVDMNVQNLLAEAAKLAIQKINHQEKERKSNLRKIWWWCKNQENL